MSSLLSDAACDPDTLIVARVRNGDLKAFEMLIANHSHRIFHTLVVVMGDVEEARDAMQESLLKALEHIGGFRGDAKFSTWLTSIAVNTAKQRMRAQKRLQSLNSAADEVRLHSRLVWTASANPEQLCSQAERRTLLDIGLTKVPQKYRLVLMLRDIEQLSTEETAAALGLAIPAVKARLFRARAMLRAALAPHFH